MGAQYPLKSVYTLLLLWPTTVGSHDDEPSPLNFLLLEVDEVLLMDAGILGRKFGQVNPGLP